MNETRLQELQEQVKASHLITMEEAFAFGRQLRAVKKVLDSTLLPEAVLAAAQQIYDTLTDASLIIKDPCMLCGKDYVPYIGITVLYASQWEDLPRGLCENH